MEIDTLTPKHIKIHPLAIISISDHHTRITSGGSALPPTSPTMGLLFGTHVDSTLSIVDAEELDPTTTSNEANDLVSTKIELHRKVFPLHHVVGWYRVGSEEGPTEDDLRRNQCEISQYCGGDSRPVFLLMNPSNDGEEVKKLDLVRDDQLPLMVFETLEGENAVFVNAEFELETFEPERIALEKVFKTAPKTTSGKESLENKNEEDSTRKVKKSKKEESKSQSETEKRPPSQLDGQLDSLQSSIRAMNARMRVLLEFLHKVEKGELPRDDALLRSVDGLLQKLPLVYAALEEGVASSLSANNGRTPLRELENDYNDTMLLSYLAAVAKTAKTVHVYTEKYRSACESSSHRS
jgi:COP9 signalosome complex subunit 6